MSRSRAGRRSARDGYSHSSANTRLNKLPSMTSWRLRIRWFSKAWRQPCKRSRVVAGPKSRVDNNRYVLEGSRGGFIAQGRKAEDRKPALRARLRGQQSCVRLNSRNLPLEAFRYCPNLPELTLTVLKSLSR